MPEPCPQPTRPGRPVAAGAGVLGPLLALLAGGCAAGPAVTARVEPLTLPFEVLHWAHKGPDGKEVLVHYRQPDRPRKARAVMVPQGTRTFESVVLENDYLRVRVIPGYAGVIESAQFKPTGEEFFVREKRAKILWPYWESGVKLSFPFHEHGGVLIDQPASYRIHRRSDGSVTVAMWMEFSRYNYDARPLWANARGEPMLLPAPHSAPVQLYSSMLVSQLVTLRPREAKFDITYRLVNPTPFRQGRKLWNTSFLPRIHTREGVVHGAAAPPPGRQSTELIFPAAHVSFHSGQQFRLYDRAEMVLDQAPRDHNSLFSWAIPHGFAGLWYPDAKVNRLRLFDPADGPGTKVYFEGYGKYDARSIRPNTYNFVELWGGADNVFEGTENWIGPGQSWQMTHSFALVSGIGKVHCADRGGPGLAVSADFVGPRPAVEVVTLRPVASLAAAIDGKALGRAVACAPDRPARFPIPAGRAGGNLVLVADGKTVLDRPLPLRITPNTDAYEPIRRALANTPENTEIANCGRGYGRAIYRKALDGYPDGTVRRGRVLFRDGQIAEAVRCLTKATTDDPADGEGWHLLGACLLQLGRPEKAEAAFRAAVARGDGYESARYFLAVLAVGRGDLAAARQELSRLIARDGRHWEARLLRTFLDAGQTDTRRAAVGAARGLVEEDPADPRAAGVLVECLRRAGDPSADALQHQLDRLLREPGARRRMAEFLAATRGRYMPHARLGYPQATSRPGAR